MTSKVNKGKKKNTAGKRRAASKRTRIDAKKAFLLGFMLALFMALVIAVVYGAFALISWVVSLFKSGNTKAATPPTFAVESEVHEPLVISERNREKEDFYYEVEIISNEPGVKSVNVRHDPWIDQNIGTKVKVGTKFIVLATFTAEGYESYVGFLSSELASIDADCSVGGYMWISKQYLSIRTRKYAWAVHTRDYGYKEKYGRSHVTVRDAGEGNPNVRCEPSQESVDSSYGRILNNTTFDASKVYVSDDKQWFGFPSDSFSGFLAEDISKDPDGVVWIYQRYVVIDPY